MLRGMMRGGGGAGGAQRERVGQRRAVHAALRSHARHCTPLAAQRSTCLQLLPVPTRTRPRRPCPHEQDVEQHRLQRVVADVAAEAAVVGDAAVHGQEDDEGHERDDVVQAVQGRQRGQGARHVGVLQEDEPAVRPPRREGVEVRKASLWAGGR